MCLGISYGDSNHTKAHVEGASSQLEHLSAWNENHEKQPYQTSSRLHEALKSCERFIKGMLMEWPWTKGTATSNPTIIIPNKKKAFFFHGSNQYNYICTQYINIANLHHQHHQHLLNMSSIDLVWLDGSGSCWEPRSCFDSVLVTLVMVTFSKSFPRSAEAFLRNAFLLKFFVRFCLFLAEVDQRSLKAFLVPKMETFLNLMFGYFGGGFFPLHFCRIHTAHIVFVPPFYLKCLVKKCAFLETLAE